MNYQKKSRSDDTLLTVDFNLRKLNNVQTLPSLSETSLYRYSIVPFQYVLHDIIFVELILEEFHKYLTTLFLT